MSANATWDIVPSPVGAKKKLGSLAGSLGMRRMPPRNENRDLGLGSASPSVAMLGNAMGSFKLKQKQYQSDHLVMYDDEDEKNQPLTPKGLKASSSTTALSKMTIQNLDLPLSKPSRLRKETLMSLGIHLPARKEPKTLKSALKKEGKMSRALTMASMREVQVSLPNNKTAKRCTRITFKESVHVRKVKPAVNLAEDPDELWYQNHEYRKIKNQCKTLATMSDRHVPGEEALMKLTGDSQRGLERYMRANKDDYAVVRLDAWDSVLDIQEDLYDRGEDYDDEKLASLYRNLSRESLSKAQDRAREDASAAQRYVLGEA